MQSAASSLHLILSSEQIKAFFPFMQEGVEVRAVVGVSITDLLVQQFGIPPDFIRTRITTLFLNSRAVDKAAETVVLDGSVLALSGAMPGLVGATMRSGGFYAAMRSSISHEISQEKAPVRQGAIRIKLFNLLLPELGPILLREGIVLPGRDLLDFFSHQDENFWENCHEVRLNGQSINKSSLKRGNLPPLKKGRVSLTINFRRPL